MGEFNPPVPIRLLNDQESRSFVRWTGSSVVSPTSLGGFSRTLPTSDVVPRFRRLLLKLWDNLESFRSLLGSVYPSSVKCNNWISNIKVTLPAACHLHQWLDVESQNLHSRWTIVFLRARFQQSTDVRPENINLHSGISMSYIQHRCCVLSHQKTLICIPTTCSLFLKLV